MVWRVSFFLGGSYADVVERFAGVEEAVEGGTRSALAFFFICVTLGNRKKSSNTLDITASVYQSHTSFPWHRGFAANKLSRSISF